MVPGQLKYRCVNCTKGEIEKESVCVPNTNNRVILTTGNEEILTHLVGETLDVVWFESTVVPNDVEACWCDSALAHGLRDQVEVVPFRACQQGVGNGSGRRISQLN